MTTKAKLSELFGDWLMETQDVDPQLPDLQRLITEVPAFAGTAVATSVDEDGTFVVVLADGAVIRPEVSG